jgi:hypothetical protein
MKASKTLASRSRKRRALVRRASLGTSQCASALTFSVKSPAVVAIIVIAAGAGITSASSLVGHYFGYQLIKLARMNRW